MIDVAELVRPEHTAVVTNECQEGVLGEHVALPELAKVARARGVVPKIATLLRAARGAGVTVAHGVIERRADDRGSNRNARLFAVARRTPVRLVRGTAPAAILQELDVDERDLLAPRLHGLSPMAGTELDPMLRNLGCRTIVAVGVSINVAILNLAFDAVNLGYQVVIPRDAVAGVPVEYADAVLDNTLALIATVTTCDDLAAAWSQNAH